MDDKSIEEDAGNTEIHVKSTTLIDVSLKSESGCGIKFVPLQTKRQSHEPWYNSK